MIRALRKRFDADDKQPLITPVNSQPPQAHYTDTDPANGAQ